MTIQKSRAARAVRRRSNVASMPGVKVLIEQLELSAPDLGTKIAIFIALSEYVWTETAAALW